MKISGQFSPLDVLLVSLTFPLLMVIDAGADELKYGLHNDSEAGLVSLTGNSDSTSVNLQQSNFYRWDFNLLKFDGKYLDAETSGSKTAEYWLAALRYELELSDRFSIYVGQGVEGNVFAGYSQRYNSDIGGKYYIVKVETSYWDVEAGYRYSVENRATKQARDSYLRLYSEAERNWTKTFSSKIDLEYLPNFTNNKDYQINGDISVSAAINDTFAIKSGYTIKYRNVLIPPARAYRDTQFTTSLVAKF